MTTADYAAIAAAIKGERMQRPKHMQPGDSDALTVHYATLELVANAVGEALSKLDPRFEKAAFIAACGVKP